MSNEIKALAAQYPVVVLTGARQVGKTSLLEKTFPKYSYVTLDYAQTAESAETRSDEFFRNNPCPLVIDEIQYAPSLLRQIKVQVDRHRKKGMFLVTGSQSFELMQNVSESLAGRAAILTLHGLSFQEWIGNAAIKAKYSPRDYLFRGTYPGLWENPDDVIDRDRWYQGYVTTYLERDVRNILHVGRLRDFERFLRACAIRIARNLNMSDLARDVGISPTTAKEWISVLQTSHVIYLLEPYYRSLGKRITKSPKLYFTDTGLALFLAGFSTDEGLKNSPLHGSFWENHVITQWLRWKHWQCPSAALWYWQDRSKKEIDLIVEMNQKLYPIECKLTEKPDIHDAGILKSFMSIYGMDSIGRAYIACMTSAAFDIAPGITAMPGWAPWVIEE